MIINSDVICLHTMQQGCYLSKQCKPPEDKPSNMKTLTFLHKTQKCFCRLWKSLLGHSVHFTCKSVRWLIHSSIFVYPIDPYYKFAGSNICIASCVRPSRLYILLPAKPKNCSCLQIAEHRRIFTQTTYCTNIYTAIIYIYIINAS